MAYHPYPVFILVAIMILSATNAFAMRAHELTNYISEYNKRIAKFPNLLRVKPINPKKISKEAEALIGMLVIISINCDESSDPSGCNAMVCVHDLMLKSTQANFHKLRIKKFMELVKSYEGDCSSAIKNDMGSKARMMYILHELAMQFRLSYWEKTDTKSIKGSLKELNAYVNLFKKLSPNDNRNVEMNKIRNQIRSFLAMSVQQRKKFKKRQNDEIDEMFEGMF